MLRILAIPGDVLYPPGKDIWKHLVTTGMAWHLVSNTNAAQLVLGYHW